MKSRGFTLIELLVVISIISLLSSVVLTTLSSVREKARIATGQSLDANTHHSIGDRLVGSWMFDDCPSGPTVVDNSGNNNTGTFNLSPVIQNDTATNKGCSLQTSGNSGISVGVKNFPNIEDSKTVSFWIKYTTVPTFTEKDVVTIMNSSGIGIQIGFHTGSNLGAWTNGGGIDVIQSPTVFSANAWHHIVYTFNRENSLKHSLYIDGTLVKEQLGSAYWWGTQTGAPTYATIGYKQGSSNGFSGFIDDIKIYSSTITAMEVKRLYAEGVDTHKVLVRK